ncbi:MAG: menaquinone biosynthesis protein [Thermodesulfobacteriota bacterium]
MAVEEQGHPARIGMVNFINTAPFYEVWHQTVKRPDWQVTEAPPTTLNRLLYEGELDLGFVSSHEYGVHPGLYKILGGLSISATGPVGSVFLFSQRPLAELAGAKLLLSSQSQTSVALVKIILEDFIAVQPCYSGGSVPQGEDDLPPAVMAIGDDALRLLQQQRYAHCFDLSQLWYEETGLPFVFAVWAVREEFCRRDPVTVAEIHHELQRCICEGRRQLPAICRVVAPRIPMSVSACHDYLEKIEYDLGEEKIKGLSLFFKYLIRRGEGDPASLPLDICDKDSF